MKAEEKFLEAASNSMRMKNKENQKKISGPKNLIRKKTIKTDNKKTVVEEKNGKRRTLKKSGLIS